MSVCLVTVVSGEAYARYAKQLGESADEFFHPSEKTGFMVLEGREGWPAATLYRYHVLVENERHLLDFDHVYLIDADMLFVAPVGREVIGKRVATEHPGYVGMPPESLPYERGSSAARIRNGEGERYFCGGFVGGESGDFLLTARSIKIGVDEDGWRGLTAIWHDESHLNRRMWDLPPTTVLSPSYCYPDEDGWYLTRWPSRYERKIVALDKTPAERGVR